MYGDGCERTLASCLLVSAGPTGMNCWDVLSAVMTPEKSCFRTACLVASAASAALSNAAASSSDGAEAEVPPIGWSHTIV